jgi:hypothetical protein
MALLRQVVAAVLASNTSTGSVYAGPTWATYDWEAVAGATDAVPWAVAGTFQNLAITLTAGPGAGKTLSFTLVKNGVDTALTCTIADLATTGSSAATVAVGAGDLLYWRRTASAAPAAAFTKACVEFVATGPATSGYAAFHVSVSTSAVNRSPLLAPETLSASALGTGVHEVVAVAGTITALRYRLTVAPGAGRSFLFVLYLNGVKQDGTGGTTDTRVTIADTATTGTWTGSLAVTAGQWLGFESTPTGTPAGTFLSVGVAVVATTASQSLVGGLIAGSTPGSTRYAPLHSESSWNATETEATLAIGPGVAAYVLRDLYVRSGTAIGAGASVACALRKNGTDTALAVTLGAGATTGSNVATTVTVSPGDTVTLHYTPTGTPGAAVLSFSLALVAEVVVDVTVPNVVGETEADAGTLLTAAGLTTGTVTTASSPTVAMGLVVSQSPTAGSSVAPGSAVHLVISTGPADAPPVYVIGIGEVEVVPLLATFRIQETIDAPDTMIADVFSVSGPSALSAYQAAVLTDGATAYWPLDDPSGTVARDLVGTATTAPFVRFDLGQPVVVTENGVRIFGGVVTGTREQGLTGPSATDLVVEVQATSYELSAARRVITAAISQDGAETIGAAFATLVTDYYAEVGVSLHPSQVPGPALPAATFTRSRGDAVNKQLAASVGYLQSIDFENRLRAWAPGDILAPANYDEATNPELLTGDITVERQLQNGYANRIILVGDPIPVPGHVDHFTGDGVADTWPVTYKVNGPYPYFVDGAVAQGVIQYPATSTTEAIGGVEAPVGFQWEYDPIALTIHRRLGPVAAGVAFDFPYDGLFIPAGSAEDAGEIAALGLWEHVENVTAVITDISAQDYAEALLAAKIASKDEIVRLQTRALGFHPGQTMTIESFSRELSGEYLITQVDTGSESGGILLVRSITASKSQNNTHDWRRVYQQWAGASAAQNP